MTVRRRFALDAKLRRAALRQGYDSIVLMTGPGFRKFKMDGSIPRSIELNIVELRCLRETSTVNSKQAMAIQLRLPLLR